MSPVRRWIGLSWGERLMLVKAFGLVGLIRVGLKLMPFKRVAEHARRASLRPVPQAQSPEALARAVDAISRRVLRDRPCLTQAIALWVLARRRGHAVELRIGVRKKPSGHVEAHAWIERNGRVLIGDLRELGEFSVLPPLQVFS